ncbi:MAG: helix-turn-helix transcriptional regulator [Opitutales bacterium]|nr:helix-turn-helix transcriptional regulator [Opitutales bacterium]
MMVQIKKKNPDWIIKNAKELKRYSQKDTFKLLHYTPPYQEQENLLTSVFIQYHLVNAGLAIHQKGYYHSRINDSFTDLIMVRKGTFFAKFDKQNVKITENNIIVIPPFKMCDNFAQKNGVEVYWIHLKISPFWNDVVPSQISFSTKEEFSNVVKLFDAYINELRTENPSKIVLKTIADAVILSLRKNLKTIIKPKSTKEKIVSDIVEQIAKKPFKNWRLSDVAKKIKCTEKELNVLFIDITALSFSKYIAKCKMLGSLKLIKSNKYSCDEIAKKVGFANRRSFSKAFKKYFGTPPTSICKEI